MSVAASSSTTPVRVAPKAIHETPRSDGRIREQQADAGHAGDEPQAHHAEAVQGHHGVKPLGRQRREVAGLDDSHHETEDREHREQHEGDEHPRERQALQPDGIGSTSAATCAIVLLSPTELRRRRASGDGSCRRLQAQHGIGAGLVERDAEPVHVARHRLRLRDQSPSGARLKPWLTSSVVTRNSTAVPAITLTTGEKSRSRGRRPGPGHPSATTRIACRPR